MTTPPPYANLNTRLTSELWPIKWQIDPDPCEKSSIRSSRRWILRNLYRRILLEFASEWTHLDSLVRFIVLRNGRFTERIVDIERYDFIKVAQNEFYEDI